MGIYYQDEIVEIRVYTEEERQQIINDRKQELQIKSAQRRIDNLEKRRRQNNAYVSKRLREDNLFKLKHNLRNLIRKSIKANGFSKTTKTAQILGCSVTEFKSYIENQFSEGMSWENYGEWEYDHIKPVSLAKSEQEIIELNHYSNFQPLWRSENRKKSNKVVG